MNTAQLAITILVAALILAFTLVAHYAPFHRRYYIALPWVYLWRYRNITAARFNWWMPGFFLKLSILFRLVGVAMLGLVQVALVYYASKPSAGEEGGSEAFGFWEPFEDTAFLVVFLVIVLGEHTALMYRDLASRDWFSSDSNSMNPRPPAPALHESDDQTGVTGFDRAVALARKAMHAARYVRVPRVAADLVLESFVKQIKTLESFQARRLIDAFMHTPVLPTADALDDFREEVAAADIPDYVTRDVAQAQTLDALAVLLIRHKGYGGALDHLAHRLGRKSGAQGHPQNLPCRIRVNSAVATLKPDKGNPINGLTLESFCCKGQGATLKWEGTDEERKRLRQARHCLLHVRTDGGRQWKVKCSEAQVVKQGGKKGYHYVHVAPATAKQQRHLARLRYGLAPVVRRKPRGKTNPPGEKNPQS